MLKLFTLPVPSLYRFKNIVKIPIFY